MTVCDDAAGHCITCSDEGIPLLVLGSGSDGLASCIDGDGRWTRVAIDLVGAVAPGDRVLGHAGVALVRLDEEAFVA